MTPQAILFDLDGTLTDPGIGIKNSLRYALRKFGLSPLPEETLDAFIGPPLLDSFSKYCGVNEKDSKILLQYYREYFSAKGLFENSVYAEIPELLKILLDQGKSLFVATSKPEPYARKILEHFKIAKFFCFIGGSTMDEKRTEKSEVISYVLKENNLSPDQCLMVGDRCYDIEGAHKCGLQAAAVLYGYGSEAELSTADYIIHFPLELLEI